MKIIQIVLILVILVFSVVAQEKPDKKNEIKVEKSYSKEKAEQVQTVNEGNLKAENKMFGKSKNSGKEITIKKEKFQNTISNDELGKKLNNPKKLKK